MTQLLDTAIARWDELVAAEGASADRLAQLRESLVSRGQSVDGRPLCTVLRPHFVTEEMFARQGDVAGLICSAAEKVRDALLADQHLAELHLGEFRSWMGDLLEVEARPVAEGAIIRLDASIARTRLHFIELNADTPEGFGHHDAILDFFSGLEAYSRFRSEYAVRPLRLEPHLRSTLLGLWSEWGGTGNPQVALMTDTSNPAIVSTLEVDVASLSRNGIDAAIVDFRELEFAGGRLTAAGRSIDLLQRVMPTAQCLRVRDQLGPLLEALRSGSVCMVNPFRSELLGHKAIFALMTDPEFEARLDARERAAVRDHVPWSRPVRAGRTTDRDGSEVDLVEHVLAERERLVLKPAHEYGGRGVTLGWRTDDRAWAAALAAAIEGDFIVQARVELHRRSFPSLEEAGAERSFYEDTDPFSFRGRLGGFLTRLSPSEITNVHAGGGLTASVAIGPLG